jgi:FKBP-type peptidyl-prolyl cis-trans isomerase FkpA
MTKQKIGVIVGCVLGGVALLGGAFWLGSSQLLTKKNAVDNLTYASEAAEPSENVMALGGQQQAQENAGGLSVGNSSGASNLGQLGGSNGQSPTGGSSAAGSGSGGSSSGGVNPSTFGDYEKYKNESHALFGEIKTGSGAELTANKKAAVVYKGWLTNGQMFDQSRAGSDGKLQPFTFTLGAGQVVRGWEEGLAGMKVGGSRLIIVPPAVGYGAQGQGSVPPNALMVFQVDLVAVQ